MFTSPKHDRNIAPEKKKNKQTKETKKKKKKKHSKALVRRSYNYLLLKFTGTARVKI